MSVPVYEGTTPLVSDRYIITLTAGEDLDIGQIVEFTADWTVKKPTGTGGSLKIAGITLTKASNGGKVSVVCRGLCRAKAFGSIAAGDQLTNQYEQVKTDNSSKNTSIIGTAVAAATSGGTAYILLW